MPPVPSRIARKTPAVSTQNSQKMPEVDADGKSFLDQVMEKVDRERERMGRARKARRKELPPPNMMLFPDCGPNMREMIKEIIYELPEEQPKPVFKKPMNIYPPILPKKEKTPALKRKHPLVIHDHARLPTISMLTPTFGVRQLFCDESERFIDSELLDADYYRYNNLRFGSDDGRINDTHRVTTKSRLAMLARRMRIEKLEADKQAAIEQENKAKKAAIEEEKQAKKQAREAKKAEKLAKQKQLEEEKLAKKGKSRKRAAEQPSTPTPAVKKGRTTRTSLAAMRAENSEIPPLKPVEAATTSGENSEIPLLKPVEAVLPPVEENSKDEENEAMPLLLDMNDEEVPSGSQRSTVLDAPNPVVTKDNSPPPAECSTPSADEQAAVGIEGREAMASELHQNQEVINVQDLPNFNDDLMNELLRLRTNCLQKDQEGPPLQPETAPVSDDSSGVVSPENNNDDVSNNDLPKDDLPPSEDLSVKKEAVEVEPSQPVLLMPNNSSSALDMIFDNYHSESPSLRSSSRNPDEKPCSARENSDPSSDSSHYPSDLSSTGATEASSELSSDGSDLSSFLRECAAPSSDELCSFGYYADSEENFLNSPIASLH